MKSLKQPVWISAAALNILCASTNSVHGDQLKLTHAPISAINEESKHGFRDCSICPEMIVIPLLVAPETGGDQMGGDQRIHLAPIKRIFAIGKFEVTVKQFAEFVSMKHYQTVAEMDDRNPYCPGISWNEGGVIDMGLGRNWRRPGFSQSDEDPVVCVAYQDALAYVSWLSETTHEKYRLPTSNEWLFASQISDEKGHPWGEHSKAACEYANVADTSIGTASVGYGTDERHRCTDNYPYTSPVGKFKQNANGLHDMTGNAKEWVEGCFYLDGVATYNTRKSAPGDCRYVVARGGSWASGVNETQLNEQTVGEWMDRNSQTGFRVAREME